MIFKKSIFYILILISILMNGCIQKTDIYTSVLITKEDNTNRNRIIIYDLIAFLQNYYAPAKTTFIITPAKSKENLKFAKQFEDIFRNAGFAISHEEIKGAKFLSWKIDRVGWLVRATYYIDNVVITRVYKSIGENWVSVGPFSAQNLGEPKYNPALFKKLKRDINNKNITYKKVRAILLRIRKKPNNKSQIIGYLKYGQKVKVAYRVKNSLGEYWIKLKDHKGYVLGRYLKALGD